MSKQHNQQAHPRSTQLLAELISVGLININAYNGQGLMPLHLAVKQEKYLLVESLIENGAEIDAKSNQGETALALAVDSLLPEMVKVLLNHKARLYGVGKRERRSALWLIVKKETVTPSDQSKRMLIMDLIIQHGIKSKDKSEVSYYKLCKAIINEDFRSAKRLVDSLSDVNFNDIKADNPLKFAVYLDQSKMAELLLTKGVSHSRRQSALTLSISQKNAEMAKLLLRFRTNVNVKCIFSDQWKCTHLYFATKLENIELMKLLLRHGANVNDLNYKENFYDSALHLACKQNFFDGMKLLLENHANVNTRNHQGETPLHYACAHRNLDCVRLLVEHGAELTAADKKGFTILHFAARNWSPDVVKYVVNLTVENGISINVRDIEGFTAINNTSCGNLVEFLKSGADLNIRAKNGAYSIHDCFYEDSDEDESDYEIDYECPSLHMLQRLDCLGYVMEFPVAPHFHRKINSSESYRQELDELKTETIAWNPRTRLYDVLFMSRNSLVRYFSNINLTKALAKCGCDFETRYPYFGSFLNMQCRRGAFRKNLMTLADSNLQKVFGKSVPEVCSTAIFRYLNSDDLKKFAKDD